MRCFIILILLLSSVEANAFGWRDLWKNKNQQAKSALESGDPILAAKLFQQPNWRGVANYRAGKFQQSQDAFSKSNKVNNHYNQGNALAHLGEYEEAIQAYDEALKQDPFNVDAHYNRKLLKKILKKQKPKSQQSRQNQQKKQHKKKHSKQNQPQSAQQPLQAKNKSSKPKQKKSDNNKNHKQNKKQQAKNNAQSIKQREKQQAKNQWLRRVPDEPGSLLQQIFRRDYQRRLVKRYSRGAS